MNIVLIQVVLIVVVIAVAAQLFRSRGERSQALRRIGLVVFAAIAVISILFPNVWNRVATLVGVGRGTDVVLYALVVAFLSLRRHDLPPLPRHGDQLHPAGPSDRPGRGARRGDATEGPGV